MSNHLLFKSGTSERKTTLFGHGYSADTPIDIAESLSPQIYVILLQEMPTSSPSRPPQLEFVKPQSIYAYNR